MGLTEEQINEQATIVCGQVLNEPVLAACRLEQVTMDMKAKAAGIGSMNRGMMRFGRALGRGMMPSVGKMADGLEGANLPKSFILAVTSTQVAAIEEKGDGGDQLELGKVLRSFPRQGFLAKLANPMMNAAEGIPEDRRVLILYLPLDGSKSKYLAAAGHNIQAMGSPGMPTKFMIAQDAASDALATELTGGTAPGPTLTITPTGIQGLAGTTAVDNTAALERLAALHRSGALTDAEFAAEKAKIIGG